jgi:hypothetical protein
MAPRRTRAIGTKVTDEEYARIAALAGTQTISEWARATLLTAVAPPSEPVVLGELLALRSILLNLLFRISAGESMTEQSMHQLIEQGDHNKLEHARQRLASADRRPS